jgi:CBS domain-containing protein
MTQADFGAVVASLDAAVDERQLQAALARGRQAVVDALTAHTPALTLAAAWSQVVSRAVVAAARVVGGDGVGWTWFVSGSVGRGEAIPGSDVETLITLDDGVDPDGKARAMDLAAEAHGVLERGGVYADANGVLASRGRFCRRWASWAEGIEKWSAEPAQDRGVVMTGLLADSVALDGADELRSRTLGAAARHPEALRAMLQDATAPRATIPSRLRVFATHVDNVDVKQAAVEPVVKIARWAAMAAGSDALFTLQRLDHAAAAGTLDADEATSLKDCYSSVSQIRWRHQAAAWIDGRPISGLVALSSLPPQERATLRQIGREVSGVRRKLAFRASTPSFR